MRSFPGPEGHLPVDLPYPTTVSRTAASSIVGFPKLACDNVLVFTILPAHSHPHRHFSFSFSSPRHRHNDPTPFYVCFYRGICHFTLSAVFCSRELLWFTARVWELLLVTYHVAARSRVQFTCLRSSRLAQDALISRLPFTCRGNKHLVCPPS
jgi:hypothetical protein